MKISEIRISEIRKSKFQSSDFRTDDDGDDDNGGDDTDIDTDLSTSFFLFELECNYYMCFSRPSTKKSISEQTKHERI